MTRGSIFFIFLLISSCNLSQNEKPNIILFFYDDLGYGELGVYGQKIIETKKLLLNLKLPDNLDNNHIIININNMGHQFHPLSKPGNLCVILRIRDVNFSKDLFISNNNLIINTFIPRKIINLFIVNIPHSWIKKYFTY